MERNLEPMIDDDMSVCRAATLLVESPGCRPTALESAERYLRSGRMDDASCLLVGVQTPGMAGPQLQNHLAPDDCRGLIIFVSACDNNEWRRQARRAGAFAFPEKPFTDEQLLQCVHSELRQAERCERQDQGPIDVNASFISSD